MRPVCIDARLEARDGNEQECACERCVESCENAELLIRLLVMSHKMCV